MDLTEKTLEKNYVYNGKIMNVRCDKVSLPNGNTSFREIIEHNGGVCIAPITEDNQLVFVRQFRYAYGKVILELPAGKLEKGEDSFEAGKRELEEETGMVADNYYNLGEFYPSAGYTGEVIYLYAANHLHETHMHLDDDEFLEDVKIPLDKAVEMVMSGEICDGKSMAIILKVNELMRKGEIK